MGENVLGMREAFRLPSCVTPPESPSLSAPQFLSSLLNGDRNPFLLAGKDAGIEGCLKMQTMGTSLLSSVVKMKGGAEIGERVQHSGEEQGFQIRQNQAD